MHRPWLYKGRNTTPPFTRSPAMTITARPDTTAACAPHLSWWRGLCATRRKLAKVARAGRLVRASSLRRVPFELDAYRMHRRLSVASARAAAALATKEHLQHTEEHLEHSARNVYAEALKGAWEELRLLLMWNTVRCVVTDAAEATAAHVTPSSSSCRETEFAFGVGTPLWFPENAAEQLRFDVKLNRKGVATNLTATCGHARRAMDEVGDLMRSSGFEMAHYEMRMAPSPSTGTGCIVASNTRTVPSVDGLLAQRVHLSNTTHIHVKVAWRHATEGCRATSSRTGAAIKTASELRGDACASWFRAIAERIARRRRKSDLGGADTAKEWDLVSV